MLIYCVSGKNSLFSLIKKYILLNSVLLFSNIYLKERQHFEIEKKAIPYLPDFFAGHGTNILHRRSI